MNALARILGWALLAVVLAVTAARAVRLAGGDALTAHGEVKWFGWAYRHPHLAATLARARTGLEPGETVYLAVAAGPDQVRWLRVMARYHLPEQELGGIFDPGAEPPPEGATVVALEPLGRRRPAPAP